MQTILDELISFILGFCIAADLVVQVIENILKIIFVPRFGLKISSVSFFGLFFIKQNDRWEVSFRQPSLLCQCAIGIDVSKPIPEDSEKREKQAAYLVGVLMILISLSVAFLFSDYCLKLFHGEMISLSNIFILSFVTGMVFHSVVHMGICVYTWRVVMKRLAGYIDATIKKIRQGYSFEDLNLKPIEELPYKILKSEKMLYYNLYVYYLMVTGEVEEMQIISHEITYLLNHSEFIIQYTGLYYWLVYYYSKYEIDPVMADKFFKSIRTILNKDSDANAKRVLAQYYYGIQKDMEKARKYLNEGLACVDSFSCGGERVLERKLLEELAETLREKEQMI